LRHRIWSLKLVATYPYTGRNPLQFCKQASRVTEVISMWVVCQQEVSFCDTGAHTRVSFCVSFCEFCDTHFQVGDVSATSLFLVRQLGLFTHNYGVATISRLLKIIGVFCNRSSLLQGSFAKETYNFKEPTNRSHPIICTWSFYTHLVCKQTKLSHEKETCC